MSLNIPDTPDTHPLVLSGIVFKKSTGIYHVRSGERVVTCAISNRLRKVLIYPIADRSSIGHHRVVDVEDIQLVDPVAIGDEVVYTDAGNGCGLITEVRPRRTQLTRRAPGPKPLEQVVVANVDVVIPVVSAAQPKPRWGMIDRYLASAESCGVAAMVCVTKIDLLRPHQMDELMEVVEDYRRIGYSVLLTSSSTGEGIEMLRELLTGKLSALVGMSGVGKTTLLNAVQPGLGLRVSAVNVMLDKGRHTTTNLEMFPLDGGGYIVDTPGMKTFGLWDTDLDDVGLLFREIAPHIGQCKFGLDCQHETEPGCAVKAAVERGEISGRRYRNYLSIRDQPAAELK